MSNYGLFSNKLMVGVGLAVALALVTFLVAWSKQGVPTKDTAAQTSTMSGVAASPSPSVLPTPTVVVDYELSEIGYAGQDGQTVLALLQELYPSTTTRGDGVNMVVETIEGRPVEGEDSVWVFYVNGETPSVGSANMVTKSGDVVEWRLESF